MVIKRRKTKVINIGSVKIGGLNPIAIQSMVKVPTKDSFSAIAQIRRLEKVGCSIVRLAVKDKEDACAISKIKNATGIPLVADIHFDWKLAIGAIKAGADKIRLNPGNIYKKQQIKEIVGAAKDYSVPIRVGLNSGSIPKLLKENSRLSPAVKLVKAALDYVQILEGLRFKDIVISLKGSNVLDTLEAYQRISKLCYYPLHLGLTATGFPEAGRIKSAVALGALLIQGIGDTIRISLTSSPEEEVRVARYILCSLGLANAGPEIISCPTCGRTQVDIEKIVNELQKKLAALNGRAFGFPAKIAVMGCIVNGPGEAEDADLAVVFGKTQGLLYRDAKPIRKISNSKALDCLIEEYKHYAARQAAK